MIHRCECFGNVFFTQYLPSINFYVAAEGRHWDVVGAALKRILRYLNDFIHCAEYPADQA